MAQAWERHPDQRWQAIFPSVTALQEAVTSWQVGSVVPSGVVSLLGLARDLVVDSYFAYSYALIAAEKAVQALEASLRGCLPIDSGQVDKRGLGQLVTEGAGQRRGLLSAEEADVLRSTAEFRNLIAHGKILCHEDPAKAYGPHDVLTFVESVHEAITDLYERTVRRQAA